MMDVKVPRGGPILDNGIDPQQWLDRHGDFLYRYALRKVVREDLAESDHSARSCHICIAAS